MSIYERLGIMWQKFNRSGLINFVPQNSCDEHGLCSSMHILQNGEILHVNDKVTNIKKIEASN